MGTRGCHKWLVLSAWVGREQFWCQEERQLRWGWEGKWEGMSAFLPGVTLDVLEHKAKEVWSCRWCATHGASGGLGVERMQVRKTRISILKEPQDFSADCLASASLYCKAMKAMVQTLVPETVLLQLDDVRSFFSPWNGLFTKKRIFHWLVKVRPVQHALAIQTGNSNNRRYFSSLEQMSSFHFCNSN